MNLFVLSSNIVLSSGNGSAIPIDQNVWIKNGCFVMTFLSVKSNLNSSSSSIDNFAALLVSGVICLEMSTSLKKCLDILSTLSTTSSLFVPSSWCLHYENATMYLVRTRLRYSAIAASLTAGSIKRIWSMKSSSLPLLLDFLILCTILSHCIKRTSSLASLVCTFALNRFWRVVI